MKSLVIDADRHNPDAPGGRMGRWCRVHRHTGRRFGVSSATSVHVEQRDIEQRAGECRVAVMLAGICGTDLQILHGYARFSGVPVHTGPLLAGTYPLEAFGAAFDATRSELKVLLRP